MRTNPSQSSFSAGEVSPLLYGRTDYQRVQNGLRRCRGFLPLRQGGFTRAPGTVHRGRTKGDAIARLIPFQFAVNDAVVLEFTPFAMRVWRYGVPVMHDGLPYEIETPYGAESIPRLKWVQSADVIYMVDGLQAVQRLARFALDDWTIGDAVFRNGPFENENLDPDITIQASAETGAVTLTGAGGPFVPAHVGGLMMLRAQDNPTIGKWIGNSAVAVGDRRIYDGRVYEVTAGTGTGPNPPIHTEGVVNVGSNISWRYISDEVGIVRITGVTDSNSATAEVVKRLPPRVVSAPVYTWAEGAWSAKNGHPSSITLHDQRLVLASTPASPRTVWFSAIGDYLEFEPGTEADESFAYAIAGANSQNTILWLLPGARGLHIGALGEEYSSRSSSALEALSAQTAVFRVDATIGATEAQPVAPDGRPIFIARDGGRVFELRYQFDADANVPIEMSLPADHLGVEGFEEIAWQSAPLRMAWLRRGNGDLAIMLHDPNEDVLGWAVLPLAGGEVESVAVSPNDQGAADVVTLVVRRGETRAIEEISMCYGTMHCGRPIAFANHLFAAVIAEDESGLTEVTGLDHLEGQEVHAWTDLGAFGPLTVTDGAVTLPAEVTRATVGLFDDTHLAETLDVTANVREGSGLGRQKRLKGMGLRWHRTADGQVRTVEREFGRPDVEGQWGRVVDGPVPYDAVTGFAGTSHQNLPSGYGKEVSIQFRPVGGAPMTLLAATPLVDAAGG
jgi:hypothetical protein